MELHHEELTEKIIGSAIEVHRELGPGLLESIYEVCLMTELSSRGLRAERQVILPIRYKGNLLEETFRLDLLVEDTVIVEVKAVAALAPVMDAQVLTYMKLANKPVGLLINFNEKVVKNGLRRFVR